MKAGPAQGRPAPTGPTSTGRLEAAFPVPGLLRALAKVFRLTEAPDRSSLVEVAKTEYTPFSVHVGGG